MEVSSSFSAAFRAQAASWLARAGSPGQGVRRYSLGADRLLVGRDLELPAGTEVNDVVAVVGNLRLGDRCVLRGPVFAGGEMETGKNCRLMPVAAGTRLLLGARTVVSGWADAAGQVLLRAGVQVNGPVAGARVEVAPGASAHAVFSREIAFGGAAELAAAGTAKTLVVLREAADWRAVSGLRPEKLSELDARTWFYDGSLHIAAPIDLRRHLVVRGSFTCAAGSVIEGDVKAGAGLYVGPESIVRGHLISMGSLDLGAATYFSGNLQASGDIELGDGVRGFSERGAVRVDCRGTLRCGAQVLIRGEARAHQRILARDFQAGSSENLFEYREIC